MDVTAHLASAAILSRAVARAAVSLFRLAVLVAECLASAAILSRAADLAVERTRDKNEQREIYASITTHRLVMVATE